MATRYTKLGLLAAGALVLYHVFSFIRTFLLRRQFGRRHGCQPIAKSATKDPFLGVDELRAGFRAMREHRILDEGVRRFRIYGNTHFAKELFNGFIATIEPENIKAILSLNFHDYGIGHRLAAFGPLLGAGIFDTDGEHWAASRALVRPNFNRDQVADLAAFEDLIQDLFKLLPRDGSVVDLQPLFFRYTIDSATEFLFGKSVGTLKTQQSGQDFAKAFDDSQAAVLNRMIMGPLAYIWPGRKARQSDRLCREFAQQFVDEALQAVESGKGAHEAREKQKYIFSHELAWRTPDKTRILDELMNILLAGRDTTASLLSNLFFMLAKNPSVWDKIRREVADVLDGRLPTYENLRQLKYVQCCLNESLRLHPVVPKNARQALQDTVLPVGGGKDGLSPVFVPKGMHVTYNVYAMHRRQDFYGPDADDFRPERWEDGKLRPRWEYLPFNGGPRICVGQRYALTEVAYVVVRMVQEFQTLTSRDPGPWEESLTLTVCSRNGTKVSLASV